MILTGLLLTTHSTYFLHNPGVVLPATSIISGQTAPTDLPTGQSDSGTFSVYVPSSQMIQAYVKLTKT